MSTHEEFLSARPTDRCSLKALVKAQFNMEIPDRRVCPHHQTPMDYLADSFFGQRDLLVWANRGGGKTMLAALSTVLDAIYHYPSSIRILGGSFDQSDRMADYIRDLLDMHEDLVQGKMTRTRVKLVCGSEIRMLAQSQRAVRGQHVQKIRCDEVDLFDSQVWRAVQFATRSTDRTRGSIEVLSTLHRSGGLMQQLVQEAQAGERGAVATSNEPRASATGNEPGVSATGTNQRHSAESPAPTNSTPAEKSSSFSSFSSVSSASSAPCLSVSLSPCLSSRAQSPNAGNQSSSAGYHLVNWCLWEVIERCTKETCVACLLCDDCHGLARNAEGFLRIDDAIAIKARSSRAAWEAEMLCQGAQRDWLVLPEFNLAKHVAPVQYNPVWPLYRAIDFGYTNPMVCLWLQVTPAGCVHAIQEYSASRVALEQHAIEIKRMDPDKAIHGTYVDPAGNARESNGQSCTDILASKGIICTSHGSTIVDGLELIRAALAPAGGLEVPPRLIVSPKCKKLIDAFQTYHFPPPESSHDHNRPVKDGPDHFIDALRYFFVNRIRAQLATTRGKY